MGHALILSEADLIALSNNTLPKEGIPHDAHLHRPHRSATVVEIWRMIALRRRER